MSDVELTYGAVNLVGDTFHALADYSPGSPAVVVEALARQLMDGEIVTHVRDSNRELSFRVLVTGDDVLALNEAEALLVAEVHAARNTLTLKKPGLNTPASVFDTFRGSLREVPDDLAELPRGSAPVHRVYEITLPASPYAGAVDEVPVTALPTGPTLDPGGTVLDAMDVVGSWSPVTAEDGALWATATPTVQSFQGYEWQALFTVTRNTQTTTGAYWSILAKQPTEGTLTVIAGNTGSGGTVSNPVRSIPTSRPGWRRYYFPALNATYLQVQLTVRGMNPMPASVTVGLDDLRSHSALPAASLTKEMLFTCDVPGSVPTTGTVEVVGSTALGRSLIFTAPDLSAGLYPALFGGGYYTSGGGTASPTSGTVTGNLRDMATPVVFDIPAAQLKPGAYALVAHGSVGIITPGATVTAALLSADKATTHASTQQSTRLALATGLTFTSLGVVHLPPARVGAGSGMWVRLTLTGQFGLDEVWLVPVDGDVLAVDAGTSPRLWVQNASADEPLGEVWRGTAADQSDALAASRFFGDPNLRLEPGEFGIFVATVGADEPAVTVRARPRAHSNSAQ